jgi:C-terminal processing protease CtpA/Prc
MKHSPLIGTLIALLVLTACATAPAPTPTPVPPTVAAAEPTTVTEPTALPEPTAAPAAALPPAEIANDEGGPTVVLGEWNYTSYAVATHFVEPVVALIDSSSAIRGDYSEWVPRSGQVLGTLITPLSPPPAGYQVDLPIIPGAANVDLDNDGVADPGVLVYQLAVSTNLVGDSYLEQLEQGGFSSTLSDPQTGAIREGELLVWAPDAAQGFPSSAGADGLFFTADDPVVGLPAGYTLATLSLDGSISFDRSRIAHMNVREPASSASPDFSSQGILESYNSLIDLLKVRYAYSDLRKLDWEQIRQKYLPQVQAADAAGDMSVYYAALFDLAQSIRDAHVQVTASDPQIRIANLTRLVDGRSGSIGAGSTELSDGRLIITSVDPTSPAAEAGWTFGTEIVSVNGVPIAEHIDGLPQLSAESTDEGVRLAKLPFALAFPVSDTVTLEYRLPGEQELRSATMTAGDGFGGGSPAAPARAEISFKRLDGDYGYIQWTAFNDPLYKLAVWEKFLATFHDAPGIVIDLRGNGGGNIGLMYTMASYLFGADAPAAMHWIDNDVYDDQANGLVRGFAGDYSISAPKPELTYSGPVVLLVDQDSASAAEYMPQFLQRLGRAQVVGEHGTDGAGGVIERAALPGGITFQFTKGRTVFVGTNEPNLEGKGVTLDVRVPITLENEQAKLDGGDPVLDAGLAALAEASAGRTAERLTATTWRWSATLDASQQVSAIDAPGDYTISFAEDGSIAITADCNQASGTYTRDGAALTISLGPTTAAECGPESRSAELLAYLGTVNGSAFDNDNLFLLLQNSDLLALQFEPAE